MLPTNNKRLHLAFHRQIAIKSYNIKHKLRFVIFKSILLHMFHFTLYRFFECIITQFITHAMGIQRGLKNNEV